MTQAEHRMGTFTWDVGVAPLFSKACIPVYFVRPIEMFSNQIILRLVEFTKPSINT